MSAIPEVQHALLGASSAHRWLNCPGSALLTKDMPDTTSIYAAEGTQAHSLCEAVARQGLLARGYSLTSSSLPGEPQEAPDEMKECAQEYLEAILEAADAIQQVSGQKPYIALEQRLDYSKWVPDGFGTGDCIIIGGGILHAIDYKHGKGVRVEAEGNPQLMLYALGALHRYQSLYFIHTVRWTIVQPRNGGVSQAPDMPVQDLLAWAEYVVQPTAVLASQPGADIRPGEWCRFCKAQATCRARSDHMLALEGFQKQDPRLMTPEQISDAMTRGAELARWLSDLQEYSLSELLAGRPIPGWKAVAGRSIRTWTDPEAAFARAVELGVPETMLYERKPLTLAALEKTLGKKQFAPLTEFVTVPPGKPALVPDSDKRPAITNAPTAEDDFAK